ncbi:hypothetical protein M8998_07170 [Sphingobacterium sp. lm-10]|uniref:hypothetical protein n=1 Tax=Sphingobacterium sp. lm-10 TaxID=2944904 RepID=UPI0020206FC3|nr:hypothetical protein [Sphingobacterium sp. lm-10]MCL7987714.1 hypothetical protein [Sphingobacterium sp. lm-10]
MNKRTVLKIESAVNKINNGNYGTEDLELLLTNLRFYVGHDTFTRELGDFINHSEGKTKGTLHDAIAYMFYRMLFFTNYQMEDSPALSEDTIFPYYFKKFLTLALKRRSIYENVNSKLGITRDQACNIFKKLLPDNVQGKLNKDFCTSKNLTLVSECIGLLAPGSEIDAE